MRRTGLLATFAVLLSALPMAANAQRAYALAGADIFAGPGSDYPVVARVAPGVGLRINGCLGDYSWCDVSFGPNRGWAYAGDLGYAYQNSRVPVIEYGPRLALPVITFSLGNYWDHYYRGRPFYHERGTWERHWNEHRNDYHGDYRGNRNDNHGNYGWQGNGNDRHYGNDRGNDHRQYEAQRNGNNNYRPNPAPYSGSQAEQFRRDKEAGRDTTRDNAPRPGELPRGSTTAPMDNGAGHQQ